MSRGRRIALWASVPIVATVGEAGFVSLGIAPQETLVADVIVGFMTMSAGIVMWSRNPRNRLGVLLYVAGVSWALSGVSVYPNGLLFGIGMILQPVHLSILGHVLLAYPDGRLRSRIDRVVVGVIYTLVGLTILAVLGLDPRSLGLPGENALQIVHGGEFADRLFWIRDKIAIGVLVAVVAVVVARWYRTTQTARRVYAPVIVSALLLFAALGAEIVARVVGASALVGDAIFYCVVAAKLSVPIGFLIGVLRSGIRQAGVGDFLIDLGEPLPSTSLRDALARTLHDPSAELAYWVPDRQAFVDSLGRPVRLPADPSRRAVTMIERGGQPLGVIIHDPALSEEHRLVEAASAAARLAIDNERLQAEVRATLEEVRASRARIVEAADTQRRRLERDLHDGAQQRLLSLSLGLRMARDRAISSGDPTLARLLGDAAEEAAAAISELRDLAQGIHPAVLTEEGLSAAVESLVERAQVIVSAEVPSDRYPPTVEATAYFVVCEALANVAKHAEASRVSVRVARANGSLMVEIADDGIGGADLGRGSGLRGLDDRVSAIGGRLQVESAETTGTRIRAVIPCA